MSALTRRGLAAGTAALLAGGAIVPALAASPDAGLVALCARFDALQRQRAALFEAPCGIEDEDARDEAAHPIEAAQIALVPGICALRATSVESYQARAAIAAAWAPPLLDLRAPGVSDRLVAALLRDLTGRA